MFTFAPITPQTFPYCTRVPGSALQTRRAAFWWACRDFPTWRFPVSGVSGDRDPLKVHPMKEEMTPLDCSLLTKLRRKRRVRMRQSTPLGSHRITSESVNYSMHWVMIFWGRDVLTSELLLGNSQSCSAPTILIKHCNMSSVLPTMCTFPWMASDS